MVWRSTVLDVRPEPFARFSPNSPLLKTRFSLNARCARDRQRARKQISRGFSSCLGREKIYINSFGKLGREGLQLWTQKTDGQKSRFWGRIASPGTARVSKLSYFWWEFASSSLKWVVGRHMYELTAESYQRKSKRVRTYWQDCICLNNHFDDQLHWFFGEHFSS